MGEILRTIETAKSYIGAREGDTRYSKLIKTFETTGLKYDGQGCTEVVLAFYILALGLKRAKEIIPISSYANKQSKMWKNGLQKTPSIGAIVYFDYRDGMGVSHEELVIDMDANTITTVDGNSYHTVIKRNRLKTYKFIYGYGVPDFKEDKEMIDLNFLNACIDTIKIKYGDRGALVLWAQDYLIAHGFYKNGNLDGWFSDYMLKEVKRWQKANGLLEDGIIAKFCLTFMLK